MIFEANVVKIGKEHGFIIPDEIASKMNLKEGDPVILTFLEKEENAKPVK